MATSGELTIEPGINSREIWSTIGVSENVIEASWQALVDSVQYKLSKGLIGQETMEKEEIQDREKPTADTQHESAL